MPGTSGFPANKTIPIILKTLPISIAIIYPTAAPTIPSKGTRTPVETRATINDTMFETKLNP